MARIDAEIARLEAEAAERDSAGSDDEDNAAFARIIARLAGELTGEGDEGAA